MAAQQSCSLQEHCESGQACWLMLFSCQEAGCVCGIGQAMGGGARLVCWHLLTRRLLRQLSQHRLPRAAA
jgi:hypothetical protein